MAWPSRNPWWHWRSDPQVGSRALRQICFRHSLWKIREFKLSIKYRDATEIKRVARGRRYTLIHLRVSRASPSFICGRLFLALPCRATSSQHGSRPQAIVARASHGQNRLNRSASLCRGYWCDPGKASASILLCGRHRRQPLRGIGSARTAAPRPATRASLTLGAVLSGAVHRDVRRRPRHWSDRPGCSSRSARLASTGMLPALEVCVAPRAHLDVRVSH
jgi:hypothetical protein